MKIKLCFTFALFFFILHNVLTCYADFNYYINDHLGNTRVVLDETGNVKETYDYHPFGMTLRENISGTQPARYKFTGKEQDNELGLGWYYFGARYYDPSIGRWLTVDPLANNKPWLTPYHYCSNNPINRFDPDGKDDWIISNKKNVTLKNIGTVYFKSGTNRIITNDENGNLKIKTIKIVDYSKIKFRTNLGDGIEVEETGHVYTYEDDGETKTHMSVVDNLGVPVGQANGGDEIIGNEDGRTNVLMNEDKTIMKVRESSHVKFQEHNPKKTNKFIRFFKELFKGKDKLPGSGGSVPIKN